jgi:tRNA-(ms[2]io[6]A)-hydroxylase
MSRSGGPEPGYRGLLACATPAAWVEHACAHVDSLLLDHASCEKKAASTAVALLFRYPEHDALVQRLSRLAREELRHFEQVRAVIARRGIRVRRLRPTRYAGALHRLVRGSEPARLMDSLIAAALIEARSAERFAALIPALDADLAAFYGGLHAAEARHCDAYLALARQHGDFSFDERLAEFAGAEAALITEPDRHFGFHSGPPPGTPPVTAASSPG